MNAIAPGVFAAELTAGTVDGPMAEAQKAALPVRRFSPEGELDGILIYLASDTSSFCTGQVIYVDGEQICKM